MKNEKIQVRCEKIFKQRVEDHCRRLGIKSPEWIRGLILKELNK